MCVSLLQVAKAPDKLLAGDVFVVGKQISLCSLSSVVDKNVGVGRHACHGADHVTINHVSK